MSALKESRLLQPDCPSAAPANANTLSPDCRQTIAAEQSAKTSAASNDLALVGAILSVVSLLAILTSLWQTRKALSLAREEFECARADADVANRHTAAALDVARDSAAAATRLAITTEAHGKLRTRAYVYVEINKGDVRRGEPISMEFKLRNQGETPALGLRCATAIVVRRTGWNWSLEPESEVLPVDGMPEMILGKGQEFICPDVMDEALPEATYEAIKSGNASVYARAIILYRTVHGDNCETVLSFEFSGKWCFQTKRPRVSTQGSKFT